jgi:hypothetical protein
LIRSTTEKSEIPIIDKATNKSIRPKLPLIFYNTFYQIIKFTKR